MNRTTLATLGLLTLTTSALLAGCGGQDAGNNATGNDTSAAPATTPTTEAAPTVVATNSVSGPATAVTAAPATKASTKGGAKKAPGKAAKTGSKITKAPNGLIMEDTKVGDGAAAKAGDTVTVNYVGTLTDGTKFDASADHPGGTFDFKLGAGGVIKGWDQGVAGMKVGGHRKLTCPPDLAYGAASPSPAIPPNSTLVFEIDLIKVTP